MSNIWLGISSGYVLLDVEMLDIVCCGNLMLLLLVDFFGDLVEVMVLVVFFLCGC